jgi:ABC-2 type transport system permease protein
MHSFLIFLQKEITEQLRTKRFFILLCVFVFFAILSPVLARYIQEFINMVAGAEMPIGLEIPPPVWIDSWVQLYGSNLAQIGALAIIFLFMGSISDEKKSGSAALTLTKNLSHTSFVLAKYSVLALMIIVAMVIGITVNYIYTYVLFDYAGEPGDVVLGAFAYLIVLLALLSVIILASAISRSNVTSGMLAFGGYLLLVFSNNIPVINKATPGELMVQAVNLTAGEDFSILPSVLVTITIVVICLVAAIHTLKKQEI